MKLALFTSAIALLIASSSQAQCVVFSEDTIETCPNVPVTFTGNPSSVLTAVQDQVDFNSGTLPAGWSTTGGTSYSQPCGQGINNTPYFWASTSGVGSPIIQSDTYDFSAGGLINFDFIYAVQGGAAPCEGPDLAHEGVSLQYSIDGGVTWNDIVYYSPGGFELYTNPGTTAAVASGPTAYTSWNSFSVAIPAAAETPNTILRWVQLNSSGTCCDNWGVDNINVLGTTSGLSYLWNTGATTLELTTSSDVDSTFTLSVFDANNTFLCEESVVISISNQPFDNAVQVITQNFTQGQQTVLFVDAYNDGCPAQSGEIVVKLDPLLTFNSSNPIPDVITSDSLIYNYSSLYLSGPHHVIEMSVNTSQSAVVGDSVSVQAYITPIAGDAVPANNTKNYTFPVSASYDPNDKKVYPTGDCDVGYVPNDQLMTYTVRFQNTGNSEAIDVSVIDFLDADLDPSTLKVVATSHPMGIDWIAPNVIDFVFDSIMLPAQSQNEVASNGYIVFEIEQLPGLTHGTAFTNQVDIYFDFNAPITTNEVLNTVTDGSHYVIGDTLEINTQSAYNWNGDLLTSSGLYTQTFPLPDGCDSTGFLLLILESDAGLNSLSNNPFVIYPNPAKDHLVVKGNQSGTIRLISSSGQVILTQSISGDDIVTWGSIAAGMYVVEITSENKTYREKVVIKK